MSPRLHDDFGNGIELYAKERRGEVIHLPTDDDDRPSRTELEWHLASVFKAA